jgi:arylsulfatase A-like enzyme
MNDSISMKRLLAAGLIFLAGGFAAFGAEPQTNLFGARTSKLPNIIVIVADDLGYGDLGCYGQTNITTPHIDALAKEGMRFTQAYSGSALCAPSRASLLTGLHSGHTSIRGNEASPLRAEEATVAELLQKAGYKTIAIGKWGLGLMDSTGAPNKKGFDEFIGFPSLAAAENYYPEQIFHNTLLEVLSRKGQYSQDLLTMVASNAVRINKYFPFFLYLSYPIPHPNNELAKKTGNGMEVPSDRPYSDEKWPQPEKNKAAMITRLDASVGTLMAQLKDLRLENDTIVFFTSDNGPHKEGGIDPKFFHSAGALRGIKHDLYEGGIRVPMIVRWPGKIKSGSVSDQPWAFWDFLPTALQIAETNAPAGIDGISILPTLLGQTQTNQHDFLYWELNENGLKQAVRMGDWKAVRPQPGKPLELYNLKEDTAETNNVADKNPEILAKIESYLKIIPPSPAPLKPALAQDTPPSDTPKPASSRNANRILIIVLTVIMLSAGYVIRKRNPAPRK